MSTQYWYVEKAVGINRFYLIFGYNEKRIIWKDNKGMSDFICQEDAQIKADKLNNKLLAYRSPVASKG